MPAFKGSIHLAKLPSGAPEIFHTVQGEGITTGQQRTFIRTTGCNLSCVWCDTPYTWNWTRTDFKHEKDEPHKPHKFSAKHETIELTIEETAERAIALGCNDYVITGGEPLLQQDAVQSLIKALSANQTSGYIEIETNGTIEPTGELINCTNQFNVSPKLQNAKNDPEKALNQRALTTFANSNKGWFKFVVSEVKELDEISHIVKTFRLPEEKVMIMPKGTTSKELRQTLQKIVQETITRGFNISDRLHVHLFGAQRGT